MSNREMPMVIPPKYTVEVRSFSQVGNSTRTFDLHGNSAQDLIDQFESLRLAELGSGYDAHLPSSVYALRETEAQEGRP